MATPGGNKLFRYRLRLYTYEFINIQEKNWRAVGYVASYLLTTEPCHIVARQLKM
jgi:hypothetical protein